MRFLITHFILITILGLTMPCSASESVASCTTDASKKCPEAAHSSKSQHKDPSSKMNSLFPEKQKITKYSTQPTMVELTTPKFMAKSTAPVRLEWLQAQGANAYHVQIATDPNFKWLVVDEHFIKTTSFEFAKLETGHKYFWRVAAFNTDNDSMSTKSNFTSSIFIAK